MFIDNNTMECLRFESPNPLLQDVKQFRSISYSGNRITKQFVVNSIRLNDVTR